MKKRPSTLLDFFKGVCAVTATLGLSMAILVLIATVDIDIRIQKRQEGIITSLTRVIDGGLGLVKGVRAITP